jgi:preprotein translocase subunit SecE
VRCRAAGVEAGSCAPAFKPTPRKRKRAKVADRKRGGGRPADDEPIDGDDVAEEVDAEYDELDELDDDADAAADDAFDDDEDEDEDRAPAKSRSRTAAVAGSRTRTAARTRTKEARPGIVGRIINYIREIFAELQKVIWPTRKELLTYTTVVIIFVAIMMTFVSLLDVGFARLMFVVFGSNDSD